MNLWRVVGTGACGHGGGNGGVQRRAPLGTTLPGIWPAAAHHGGTVRQAVSQESRSKNDRTDAEAIATAARQGNMRFVPVKSIDQQVRLSWHRVREGYKVESLAIGNRIRGLLAEFGVIVAQSDRALRRLLADLDAQVGLPAAFKELLRDLAEHWSQLRLRLDACDARIEAHAREDERGVGCAPSSASARSPPMRPSPRSATRMSSSRGGRWRRGWAWCPRNTQAVGTRGWGRSAVAATPTCERYSFRARAAAWSGPRRWPRRRPGPERWIRHLDGRMPFGKVIVAIAKKHAWQIWAMLAPTWTTTRTPVSTIRCIVKLIRTQAA